MAFRMLLGILSGSIHCKQGVKACPLQDDEGSPANAFRSEMGNMPYSFEFDAVNRILRAALEGRITDLEMRALFRLLFWCVATVKPSAGIVDTSGVLAFDVSTTTIHYLASCAPPFPPGVPRFIVAPATFMFGVARMFQGLVGDCCPDLRVVRSALQAYSELGVAVVRFERLQLNYEVA